MWCPTLPDHACVSRRIRIFPTRPYPARPALSDCLEEESDLVHIQGVVPKAG